MLTLSDYKDANDGTISTLDRVEISFEDLKTRVIKKIRETCLATSLESEDFKKITMTVVTDYITMAQPYCAGYVQDGRLKIKTLISDMYNSITSWGILTCFTERAEMRELQINGPSIFVDTKSGYDLLRNPLTNEIIRFKNPEDCLNFIKSTLNFSGERLSETEPLVNASSIEGYRISCTHPCIFPPHPDEPTLKWPTATYRKVGGGALTRDDFLTNGTACEEQIKFIEYTFKALIGMVFVGTTGCGKTTLMDLGLRRIDDRDRVICIQQPSEYNYRHLVDGIMVNNAVYWEVDPQADPKKARSATQNNLVTHSLRNNATALVLGECRNDEDFVSMARAINAGSEVYTSLHSFSISGTIDRMALELVSGMNLDMEVAREQACKYLRTVTLCDRLGDYSRKIMGQAEIVGYDRINKAYIINYLFEFVLVDSVPRTDEAGKHQKMVWNVGFFVKRNNPSSQYIRSLIKTGVSRKEMSWLLDIPVGTVLREINYDKLPEEYVVEYDSNIIPLANSLRGVKMREPENNIGIQV